MKLFVLCFLVLGFTAKASFMGKTCAEVESYYSKLDSYNLNKKSCEEYEGMWRGQFANGVQYQLDITTEAFEEPRSIRYKNTLKGSFMIPDEGVVTRSVSYQFEVGRTVTEDFITATYATCNSGQRLSLYICRSGYVTGLIVLNMNRLDSFNDLEKRIGKKEKAYTGTVTGNFYIPFMPDTLIYHYPQLSFLKGQRNFTLDVIKD